MIADQERVRGTGTTLVKFAFIVIVFLIAESILLGSVLNLLVDKFHAPGPRVDLSWSKLLGRPWASPLTLAMAASVWLLRRRWQDLRFSQLLVPAVGMAIVNPIVFFILLAIGQPIFHYERISTPTWTVVWYAMAITTGVLTAQLLRLRRKTSTLSYV